MTTAPIELVLPMPVNLGNARLHWRTKLAKKKAYFTALDSIALVHRAIGPSVDLVSRIPPPPAVPLDQCRITAHLVLGNLMDDDNAMARMKFVLDWLVKRGYIVNDSRRHVRWTGIPTQEVDRKQVSHVRLTITPGW